MYSVEGNNLYVGWSPIGQNFQLSPDGGPASEPAPGPQEPTNQEPVYVPYLPDIPQWEPAPTYPTYPANNNGNGNQAIEFAKKNPLLTIGAALIVLRLLKII